MSEIQFAANDAVFFTKAGRGATRPPQAGTIVSIEQTPTGAWATVKDAEGETFKTRLGQITRA